MSALGGRILRRAALLLLTMTLAALAAGTAYADVDREAVTSYDEMRPGAPYHGYFNNAWQAFAAKSSVLTHVGVTVGNPTLPGGSAVPNTIHVKICDTAPDPNGACHALVERDPQIVNYGSTYTDIGDVPVTKGATYWLVWFQPPAAGGQGWVTYWWAGGSGISTSDRMQAVVKGYDPAPAGGGSGPGSSPPAPGPTPAPGPAPNVQRFAVANATIPVNLRQGPGTTFPVVGTAGPGAPLDITCQTRGTDVFGSAIWDQLTSGAYISDYYTSTPVFAGFSPGFTQCDAPAPPDVPPTSRYQVANATIPVNLREGPSTSARAVGTAAPNSPLDIACQTVGDPVSGSRIWDRLASGAYISDFWTSTPVFAGYSPGLPHCDGAPDTVAPPTPDAATPWRVTAQIGVTIRRGAPRVSAPSAGTLPYDAPVSIECQTAGDAVGGSLVWDRLPGGTYISDYWVNTPVYGRYTDSIPRCEGAPEVGGPVSSGGAPGGGAPAPPPASAWGFAALGDSFSSGEGAPDDGDTGGRFDENVLCHRSHIAWARQVESRIGVPLRTFVACSGATTGDLTHDYRDQGRQIDKLRATPNLRFVTLTIGGNDVGFGEIAEDCIHPFRRACNDAHATDVPERIDRVLSSVKVSYRAVLDAAPGAKLFVVGYPRFFSSSRWSWYCNSVTGAEQTWMNSQIDAMDDRLRTAVNQVGRDARYAGRIAFVDVRDAFEGRGACSPNPLINALTLKLQIWPNADLTHKEYTFHPNRNGQGKLAEIIAPYIR